MKGPDRTRIMDTMAEPQHWQNWLGPDLDWLEMADQVSRLGSDIEEYERTGGYDFMKEPSHPVQVGHLNLLIERNETRQQRERENR